VQEQKEEGIRKRRSALSSRSREGEAEEIGAGRKRGGAKKGEAEEE
jgi:hypothetical protein